MGAERSWRDRRERAERAASELCAPARRPTRALVAAMLALVIADETGEAPPEKPKRASGARDVLAAKRGVQEELW